MLRPVRFKETSGATAQPLALASASSTCDRAAVDVVVVLVVEVVVVEVVVEGCSVNTIVAVWTSMCVT